MGYRARINTNDPQFQIAQRNAAKGQGAIKGASAAARGISSAFGAREGNRLAKGEQAGKTLKNQKEIFDKNMALAEKYRILNKKTNNFNNAMSYQDYKMNKGKFEDAKLGSYIGAGINALGVGVNAYGGYKDRQAAAEQAKFGEQMQKMWVQNNPLAAYNFEAQAPGMLGIRNYLDFDAIQKAKGPMAGRNKFGTSAR